MKNLLFFILIIPCFLFSNTELALEKFSNTKQCLSCHKDQANDWETTWHSRSHYDSNPLYNDIVDYISRVTYKSTDSVLISCAKCHNPKMTLKKIDDPRSYSLATALDLKTKEVEKVKDSVNDERIKSGISCYICHSVDKVHANKDINMRGFEAVEWNLNGTILGPFKDDGRAGFHKSEQREHFIDSNKLCMVCHYGGENDQGVKIYATGEEFIASKSEEKCADCHMSTQKEGVIAPHITRAGTTPTKRDMRSHLFAGARNSNILEDALELSGEVVKNRLEITLKNLTPHSAPTGFGDRNIEMVVTFLNGNTELDRKSFEFKRVYLDKRGKETISYLASKVKSDTTFKPNEIKNISLEKPIEASSVNIEIRYRLVSEKTAKLIGLKDPIFLKSYPVTSLKIDLQ